jgi:diguanylate cyclase (GGDEF)-like protein
MVFRRSAVSGRSVSDPNGRHVDGLTGLPDRWQVDTWIAEQLHHNRRTGDRFGFFLVSVSNLSQINAGYGSAVGDEVLQAVAETLGTSIGSRATLARYLGSEFALVWPGIFGGDDMYRIANEVMGAMPRQVNFDNFVVPVEIAIAGVISDPDLNERVLFVDTETALSEAKARRSDPIAIRDESHNLRRRPEVLAIQLQRAFESDQFQLYYQPILSLRGGTIVGFEAMLRWLSPDAGPTGAELVTPGFFLEALRHSPIVVPLHAWIIQECASQISAWSQRLGNPALFGSTNMDATFVRNPLFIDVVTNALAQKQLRPQQMLLDVNANMAGNESNLLWSALAGVKQAGVGIALEDFGIGLGSVDVLRRCRFDVIRLPRALVAGLALSDEDRIIVGGLVRIAHELGCHVIADGVETEDQARVLKELGCDMAQGYLFARPISEVDVSRDINELKKMAARVKHL